MSDFDWCPVCRRCISVSSIRRLVMRHRDKAGTRCPMSGKPFPLCGFEAA